MTMLDAICKRLIQIGTLRVIDSKGHTHTYKGTEHPRVTIRFSDQKIERQLLLEPEVALGEAYMQGTLSIEEGTLYDLLDLCTRNLPSPGPTRLQKIFSIFSKIGSYL